MKNIDPTEYNAHFNDVAPSIKAGPVDNEQRSCGDICCLITFFILVLGFVAIGVYALVTYDDFYQAETLSVNTEGITNVSRIFWKFLGVILGMFALSLVIAIIFLFLIKNCAACMVYGMIVLVFIAFIVIIVYAAIEGFWGICIGFGVALLLMVIVLCCYWSRLKTGILLLQVATQFLTEKPSVYIGPFYPLLMGILFFAFWVITFLPIVYEKALNDQDQKDASTQNGFIFVYVFMFVFMTEFLYYVMTFLIATACANWYYDIEDNYYTTGVGRINRFHIGSLTFGAIIITIINLIKWAVQEQSEDQAEGGNAILACCLCLLACCLSCIENIIRTLNHNGIIVMSVTGQSYIDCAKTALSIIFENFGLFLIVDFISDVVVFFGVLLTVGIPTLVAILILTYVDIGGKGETQTSEQIAYTALAVFFLSTLIGSLIISLIGEALSCVFIFYCFDSKFRSIGVYVPNTPAAIREFHQQQEGLPGSDRQLR